jgi:hypothetical protein
MSSLRIVQAERGVPEHALDNSDRSFDPVALGVQFPYSWESDSHTAGGSIGGVGDQPRERTPRRLRNIDPYGYPEEADPQEVY